ncbi:hypothetical protein BXZ70DRAFT_652707 [Cristinia sonorae]|uniref:Uncharacterized protein n=1 Tax=Cristinia sonorae TaxID=1940300 RepID=A0A8K0UEN6_9AGAR|nr:hypothetical protein BXZ70DRAFT_652707 [Cristinia sonorae]
MPKINPTSTMRFLTLASLFAVSAAFTFPSWLPFVHSTDPQAVFNLPESAVDRIAIIGAGAAGSSAAFWIAQAKARYGLDVEVDVYEKSALIGGRALPGFSSRLRIIH